MPYATNISKGSNDMAKSTRKSGFHNRPSYTNLWKCPKCGSSGASVKSIQKCLICNNPNIKITRSIVCPDCGSLIPLISTINVCKTCSSGQHRRIAFNKNGNRIPDSNNIDQP